MRFSEVFRGFQRFSEVLWWSLAFFEGLSGSPRFFSKGLEGSHGSKVLSRSVRVSQVVSGSPRFSNIHAGSLMLAEVRSVSPMFAKVRWVRQRRLDKVRKVLFWFAKVR